MQSVEPTTGNISRLLKDISSEIHSIQNEIKQKQTGWGFVFDWVKYVLQKRWRLHVFVFVRTDFDGYVHTTPDKYTKIHNVFTAESIPFIFILFQRCFLTTLSTPSRAQTYFFIGRAQSADVWGHVTITHYCFRKYMLCQSGAGSFTFIHFGKSFF